VGTVTLLLLVPDSSDNLDELLVKLPGVSLQELVQEWLPQSEVSVSLPQFTIVSSAIDVTPFLRQLGVRVVFNATSADLRAATAAPAVHVKSIMQDAFFSTSFIAVNSVGSVSTNLGKCFSTVTTVITNSVDHEKLIVVQLVRKFPLS
jgi:serine protease inhibitor